MALTGDENSSNIRSPVSPIDQLTGANAAIAVLAAIIQRGISGKGTAIQTSLLESAISLQRYNLENYWILGKEPSKCGSGHESLCPYQVFRAQDGDLMLGVANDSLWQKFCQAADLQNITDLPQFATNRQRAANRSEVITLVQAAVSKHPVEYWYEKLSGLGIPCSPIYSLEKFSQHPHLQTLGMIGDYEHSAFGPAKAVLQPFSFHDTEREVGTEPPTHGQHNHEILSSLGLSEQEIESLQRQFIIS